MELNYIQEFVALAEYGSFSRTADTLFISQSSLSKHIKTLEKELGAELFDRTGPKITLTDFGSAFLPYAQKLNETRIAYQKDLFTKDESHIITVGISPLYSSPDVATSLSSLHDALPEFHIDVLQHAEPMLIRELKHGDCDMLIISASADRLQHLDPDIYQVTPILRRAQAALLPDNHPLAQQDSVYMDELFDMPFISLGKEAKNDPRFGEPIIFVERVGLIINLVQRGFGVSVLPALDGLLATTGGVKAIPISGSEEIEICLVCPRNRRTTALMQKIISSLKQDF